MTMKRIVTKIVVVLSNVRGNWLVIVFWTTPWLLFMKMFFNSFLKSELNEAYKMKLTALFEYNSFSLTAQIKYKMAPSSSQPQYYILTLTLCVWSHVTRLHFGVHLWWNVQICQNSGSCNEKTCESFLRKKSGENAETIFVQFTLTLFHVRSGLWRNLQKSDILICIVFNTFSCTILCMTFL